MTHRITLKNTAPLLASVSIMALVATLGLTAVPTAQAAEMYEADVQLSMLKQSPSHDQIRESIKALDAEYTLASVKALNRSPAPGPDLSKEEVYVDYIIDVLNGSIQPANPKFTDEESYINYLVKIVK